jgi:hypothetical protein
LSDLILLTQGGPNELPTWQTRRTDAFAMTALLWHGATIAGVATLCALMGRRWLRWPTATVR